MAATHSNVVSARPAETLTVAGAGAFLLARSFGVDNDQTLTALTMVIAFMPAAITWLVQLFSRGAAGTSSTSEAPAVPEPREEPRDPVAKEVKALAEVIREAVAEKSPSETKATSLDGALLDAAVERVLAAKEAERAKNEEMSEAQRALIDLLRWARAGAQEARTRAPASRAPANRK